MKITIEHLTKDFGSMIAVNDFNAVIESGELIALLGPSGCGKSTMLNMISGILPSTTGKIYFDEDDVTERNRIPMSDKFILSSAIMYLMISSIFSASVFLSSLTMK